MTPTPIARRSPQPRYAAALALVLACGAWSATGCRSEQVCKDLDAKRVQAYQTYKRSMNPAPKIGGPVVVGAQLSEAILQDALREGLTSKGDLSYTSNRSLPLGLSVKVGVHLKDLDGNLGGQCANCVRLTSKLEARVLVKAGGKTTFSTDTKGALMGDVPVVLSEAGADSKLTTDLSKLQLRWVNLRVNGLPKDLKSTVDKLARDAIVKALKKFGEPIELVRWEAVRVPESRLMFKAQQLKIFPKERVAWVGWSSNLSTVTDAAAIAPAPTLKPGEHAALTLSGPALTALTHVAMDRGEIPTRFNTDFKPDPNGPIHVLVDQVTPTADSLDTRFTAWNLSTTDACYQASFRADTALTLRASATTTTKPSGANPNLQAKPAQQSRKRDLKLTVNDIELTGSEGDDSMIRVGLWLRSVFVEEALSAQTRILSARTFPLGRSNRLQLKATRIDLAPSGATVVLAPELQLKGKRIVPGLRPKTPKATTRTPTPSKKGGFLGNGGKASGASDEGGKFLP